MKRMVEQQRQRLAIIMRATLFRDPRALVTESRIALQTQQRDLHRVLHARLTREQARLERLAGRLRQLRPDALASRRRQQIAVLDDRLRRALHRRVDQRQILDGYRHRLAHVVRNNAHRVAERLNSLGRQLAGLGPDGVLARGYSYTTTARGQLIRSAKDARPGQHIVTRMVDGAFGSTVDGPKGKSNKAAAVEQMDLFGRSE